MTAMMQLHKTQPDSIVVLDQFLRSNELEKSPSSLERCHMASHKNEWGVHFSHYDVSQSRHTVFERPHTARVSCRNG